jgi:hypothetical protein
MSEITLPSPPPVPIAGDGGPDTYQSQYNLARMKSLNPVLLAFYYGRPGAPTAPDLSQADRENLANNLYEEGIKFDQQIDFWGWDAYQTNYVRFVNYGYTRVPRGTGTTPQPANVVNTLDLVGPVIPGYLTTSIDIADYPPYKEKD